MKTGSDWVTYDLDADGWNTNKAAGLDVDGNGYPTEIPQIIDGRRTAVRVLVNNHYTGRYRFLYDGDGDFSFNLPRETIDGKIYFTFNGEGGHRWFQITRSNKADPLCNFRIIPEEVENTYDPANPDHYFYQPWLRGLRPLYGLRFMEWRDKHDKHAAWAEEYDVDIVMYEGGQHMQPWQQKDWDYNQAVWVAQIHPKMYDLYVKAWSYMDHVCGDRLGFMGAFAYISKRESK
jgi:hypothetical protein